MHPYQVDEEIRKRVFIISAFLAVGLARIFSLAIEHLPFSMPWWIETPSVLGFFGLCIWLYDNHLWKLKLIQQIAWFYIPNINGKWDTEIQSSHEGFNKPIQAHTIIRQTASKISISIETDTSHSHNVTATLIRTNNLNRYELTYNYINHPKADALDTMNIHQGSAWLQISDDGKTLNGEYYSGRGRQNFGKIILKRQ